MSEDDLIETLRTALGGGRRGLAGIGDDACELRAADGRVVCVDAMVEGVHFRRDWSSWQDVAFKCLAANVSDAWAMGAEPTTWLLTLGLPPELATRVTVEALCEGFSSAQRDLDLTIALVGGDTVRAATPFLSITLVAAADAPPLTRDGARVGQSLWVDGELGLAAAGLACLEHGALGDAHRELVEAHRRPRPSRLLAASARAAGVTAAIDISDGLCWDIARVARASDVGIELDARLIPGRQRLQAAAVALDLDVDDWLLEGGDDYVRVVCAQSQPGQRFKRIGAVIPADAGLTVIGPDGTRSASAFGRLGYQHFGAPG